MDGLVGTVVGKSVGTNVDGLVGTVVEHSGSI